MRPEGEHASYPTTDNNKNKTLTNNNLTIIQPVQFKVHSSKYTIQFKEHDTVQVTQYSLRYRVKGVQFKLHGIVQGTQYSSRYTVQCKVLVQFKVHGTVQGTR